MELLFAVNLLRRNGSSWDSENAQQLLRYSIRKNYSQYMHLELGNGMVQKHKFTLQFHFFEVHCQCHPSPI